jgi:type III pantothenate kinase
MKITLCFDFGNTRLKAALFEDDIFREEITLQEGTPEAVQQLLEKYHPVNTILSSVIDHDMAIEDVLAHSSHFHKLSHTTRANFTTPVGRPDTIGADRLALCAAAVHFFPGKHNLVIGLGSCITYNFITQDHDFIGGAISPGLAMRFRAMHVFTAKLPEVAADWNYPLIGYDTKTNMQSGVINGMVYEIDGFIDAYAAKYGNFNVLLTGGDSAYFAGQLKNRIFADPNFLFKGLYALSETNNG